MTRSFFAATATMIALAAPAAADQFAVQLTAPYEGAGRALMETLRVTEIDRFSVSDAHFVILDAPTEGHVEALIIAINRDAVAFHTLDADWLHPTIAHLTPAQRLGLFQSIFCDFCTS